MTNSILYRLLCTIACTFFLIAAISQNTVESLLEQPVSELPAFDTTKCKNCIFLEIPYGTSDFRNLDVLKRFEGNNITQVDMVFSSFARTEGFDQVKLNRQRLLNFQAVAPELFDNDEITWTMLRQTACKSLEESEKLFHGFVVHIAPGKSKRDNAGKLAPVAETSPLTKKESKVKPRLVTRDTVIREMNVSMREITKRECEYTGKYIPKDKKKAKAGIRYDSKGSGRKPEKKCKTVSYGYVYDTTYFDRIYKINAKTGKPLDPTLDLDRRGDTTVLDALDRNWDDWKNEKVIVVQDVTGSMTKYLMQILTWHELYAAKGVEHYVFFNDGDGKADSKKIIGKIGGIYYVNSNRLADIQSTAQQAAKAGSGGDSPENNIEAALYAQSKCPECSMIVMIADNNAKVKDFTLLKDLKKPVHVVACGGDGTWVHSDYLSIAAVTGGSVHTSKIDLELKGKAVEGEVLTVGAYKYTFKEGRFNLPKE